MRKKSNFFLIFGFLFFTAIAVGIVNTFFGILVYFFSPEQNIFYHTLSPYLFIFLFLLVSLNIAYKCFKYRHGGQAIASYFQAIPIDAINGTPEEIFIHKLNQDIANEYNVLPASLYFFDKQLSINVLTVGFSPKDVSVILTWGALQSMNRSELKGILAFEYCKILNGHYIENTKIDILFSGFLFFSQLGSRIIVNSTRKRSLLRTNNFAAIGVALGGFIWLLGWVGVLLSRVFKFIYLFGQIYILDLKTSDTIEPNILLYSLTRIYVHKEGSSLHRVDSETLSHYCFANALSEQSWFEIHPTLVRRIYNLQPQYERKNVNPNSKEYFNWQSLIARILLPTNEEKLLTLLEQQNHTPNLPLLRLSPVNINVKDAIRPLALDIRQNMERPELLKRAMQTAAGCREVIVAIFIIRQYRDYIPIELHVSKAIIEALLKVDARIHIQIFYEALRQIGDMPRIISRQYISKLIHIIEADGQINLLDCLLLDKVKANLGLLDNEPPIATSDSFGAIVHLVDAFLHIQPINSAINPQQLRLKILKKILPNDVLKDFQKYSDIPVDLEYSLKTVSGLLERENLYLLMIIEQSLWSENAISQDELDVLELLYWRFGFESKNVVDRMIKHNSLLIL